MFKYDLRGRPGDDVGEESRVWLPKDLIADEKVLWAGQPTSPLALIRMWRSEAIVGLVMTLGGSIGIVATSVSVLTPWVAVDDRPEFDPWGFAFCLLYWLLLLLFGLAMLSKARRIQRNAGEVRYVLTAIRLVMRTLDHDGELVETDILPDTLREIRRTERVDGSGDLLFGTPPPSYRGRGRPFGIFSVEDVAGVELMLRKTLGPVRKSGYPGAYSRPEVWPGGQSGPER